MLSTASAAALAAVLGLAPTPHAVAVDPPRSITGTNFYGGPSPFGTTTVTGGCSATGSTVTFVSQGTTESSWPAYNNRPFTESGQFELGPSNGSTAPVIGFSATFGFVSADGIAITGTKEFNADYVTGPSGPSPAVAQCNPDGTLAFITGTPASTETLYVTSGGAAYTEDGIARARLDDYGGALAFFETFLIGQGLETADLGAATLTLDPPAATNPVGTAHTVTATANTAGGQDAIGVSVLFRVSGSVQAAGHCDTGPDGTCTFTYQGPDLPGADSITACADNDSNGVCGAGEPTGEATKAWLLPTSTAGKVTGGGQVPDLSDANRRVAFGFTAQAKDGALSGHCSLVDQSPARNLHIKCLDVTALVQSGSHATFLGTASVNGTSTTYRIDVDDFAEPGRGVDTFMMRTSSGYLVSGTITQGNIQAHS